MSLGWASIFHFCYFYHKLNYYYVSVNPWMILFSSSCNVILFVFKLEENPIQGFSVPAFPSRGITNSWEFPYRCPIKTLATRSLVNVDVPSKSFQCLILTSRGDMFQLKNFHMLLEFAFNQIFAPSKFPLDSHKYEPWWDRSCDLALMVGNFIHGLGKYEAMWND